MPHARVFPNSTAIWQSECAGAIAAMHGWQDLIMNQIHGCFVADLLKISDYTN
jgi:hypothetical protein